MQQQWQSCVIQLKYGSIPWAIPLQGKGISPRKIIFLCFRLFLTATGWDKLGKQGLKVEVKNFNTLRKLGVSNSWARQQKGSSPDYRKTRTDCWKCFCLCSWPRVDSQNSLCPAENLKTSFSWEVPGWMPMKFSEGVATDTFMHGLCIHLTSFMAAFLHLCCYSHKYLYKQINLETHRYL